MKQRDKLKQRNEKLISEINNSISELQDAGIKIKDFTQNKITLK